MKVLLFYSLLFFGLVSLNDDFDRAEQLFKKGQWSQAKTLFEGILKENPNHVKTLEYLGDIEGSKMSWDKALKYFGKLKQLKPQEANYYYKYGGCLAMKAKEGNKFKALGMIDDIRSSFEKAIQLNPNHVEARWALIELYLELPVIVGGSEAKAQKYATELLKISPVDGYLAKGRIDEYFERYKAAEKNYIKAHKVGNSKTTFQKLYNLYLKEIKDAVKAQKIKAQFEISCKL